MAFTAYLFVKPEKGNIKGFTGEEDKTTDGKSCKDLSRVQGYQHKVFIPTHQQTGEAQGPGEHTPLLVTIEVDRAAAALYKALTLNQIITEAKVYFFRAGAGERAGGTPDELFHNWFTVTITDARVVGVELKKTMVMEGQNVPDLIQLTFTYRKIKWEDHDDKQEAEYDWKKKAGS
jgi:type VI secretion system Hcp family effector